MHPSIEKARALLAELQDFTVTERDPLAEDALEHWDALRQRSTRQPTRRHAPLVYKRLELQPVQQQSTTMDPATQKVCDDWAEGIAKTYAGAAIEVLTEKVNAENRALREEIDELRNELALLRGQVDGSIKTLRGRDADAA